MAVTRVPRVYQCAETASTARGRGNAAATERQPSAYRLRLIPFIGLPWPTKRTGMYALAVRRSGDQVSYPVEGFDGGSVSMLSVRIG